MRCACLRLHSSLSAYRRQITQSIAFSCVLFFASTIPSLPLSVYQTFVLEERHGFNKTTPGLFVADMLKGWGIGFVIGAPFLGAFLYVFKWAGDRFVPWLMGFLCVSPLLYACHATEFFSVSRSRSSW